MMQRSCQSVTPPWNRSIIDMERLANFVQAYLEHLKADYANWQNNYKGTSDTISLEVNAKMITEFNATLRVEQGQKYLKVIHDNSVHCFIDTDGFIWKPASWRGPTKNFSRGNVNSPESYKNHRWAGL